MFKDYQFVQKCLRQFQKNLSQIRSKLERPLTYAEKILFVHLAHPNQTIKNLSRGKDYIFLNPDRVALQDATAQMALLQFMLANKGETAVPTTVHCDHLIRAEQGAQIDLKNSQQENEEVYDFLSSASQNFGLGFWKPGAGIIHQVFLEQYAFPGGLAIGTDSHTPNAGGIGTLAIGVGGSDAVDVMLGLPWELKLPRLMGVKLTGALSGWASPKDVILKLASLVSAKGGTGFIVEYFGPGCESLSCTGKATICNMGAEIGATTSLFPYDEKASQYLHATARGDLTEQLKSLKKDLRCDPEVESDPHLFFDQIVEIDLSKLEPLINGPFTPDLSHSVSEMKQAQAENQWPDDIKVALIGSCTNSSYEDIDRVADLAKQAKELEIEVQTELTVTPGSEQILATIKRDGQLEALESIGAKVLANACGPCIGQWKRFDIKDQEPNTIINSFNRNFTGRNDGNAQTHAFVASPETVVAYALAGKLSFDFTKEPYTNKKGQSVFLSPPQGQELPEQGYVLDEKGFQAPGEANQPILISLSSERLEKITPFLPNNLERDYLKLPLILKAKGKCTTDHISAAGKWLRFRGHLSNIAQNTLMGAENFFNGKRNSLRHPDGSYQSFYHVAQHYKKEHIRWVIVGEHNYGEGSSREHAAMQPRFLGCAVVLVKSFARIHETNLKRQGILPLLFSQEKDYDLIQETDSFSFDLSKISSGKVTITLHHKNGSEETFEAQHTLNELQIQWLQQGSALNYVRSQMKKAS